MKKSLMEAIERAKTITKKTPEIVRVMDKKGQKSRVNISDFVYRELVLQGFHTVATYKDGKEV